MLTAEWEGSYFVQKQNKMYLLYEYFVLLHLINGWCWYFYFLCKGVRADVRIFPSRFSVLSRYVLFFFLNFCLFFHFFFSVVSLVRMGT